MGEQRDRPYYDLGNVGIGSSSPPNLLTVTGTSGDNAAFVVNQTSAGDILSASSSGSTKLTLDNGGNLLPGSSGTQNLGSPSVYWNTLYANNIISPPTGPAATFNAATASSRRLSLPTT